MSINDQGKWIFHVGHSYNIMTWKGGVYSRYKFIAETKVSWVGLVAGSSDWTEKSYLSNPSHYRYLVKLFPKRKQGETWWAGTDEDAKLAEWASTARNGIAEKIRQYGFDNEKLLTIARMIGYTPIPE